MAPETLKLAEMAINSLFWLGVIYIGVNFVRECVVARVINKMGR
jgi:hypothetical protein